MKHWYDDWHVRKNVEGAGIYTVELPNSYSTEKKIVIKGKYTHKHVEWLIDALDSALYTLTERDKIGKL